MDWGFLSDISALGLAIWFFLCKDLFPNIKDFLYAYKDDGTLNQEMRSDIIKKIFRAAFQFPSDLISVSAGYLIGRILLASEAIPSNFGENNLLELTVQLNLSHLLFWITVLVIFPTCAWVTRYITFLYFKDNQKKWEKIIARILCALLYITSFGLVILLLIVK